MENCTGRCTEREILAGRHQADLAVYLNAAERLNKATTDEFAKAYMIAERARIVFEKSRDRLNEHIAAHKCG